MSFTDIAEAPAWLVEMFDTPAAEVRKAAADVELDLPYSIIEARRWLDRQPPAVEGSASDALYRYACRLKDFALSAETCAQHIDDGVDLLGAGGGLLDIDQQA